MFEYKKSNKLGFRNLFIFQTPYIPELALQSRDIKAIEKIAAAGTTGQDGFQEIEAFKYYFSKFGRQFLNFDVNIEHQFIRYHTSMPIQERGKGL